MTENAMRKYIEPTVGSGEYQTNFHTVELRMSPQEKTRTHKEEVRVDDNFFSAQKLSSKASTEAISRNFVGLSILPTNKNEDELETASLPNNSVEKELKGVVSKLTDESVFIKCQLPHDNIELCFPKNILDVELAVYGKPVFITLEKINGFKQPVIKSRNIVENPHYKSELKQLSEWAEQL